MALVRTLIGNTNVLVHFAGDGDNDYAGLESLGLDAVGGALKIPVDSNVATFVPYRGNMSYGYFVEARTKRQITWLFGQYVPAKSLRK